MDVHTGKVLALASYPSYDLNLFKGGSISDADYQTLLDDDRAPLFNKAISSKGIPGSIFKMVTGVAGLWRAI
jgi:penicillin-binding protein 2